MAGSARTNDHEDAVTDDESAVGAEAEVVRKRKETNNAFSELMKPKRPKVVSSSSVPSTSSSRHHFPGRDGLGVYITNPTAYLLDDSAGGRAGADPSGRVIFYTDDFVAIHDKFPKATVHCLLLPRDPRFNLQHPVELLSRQGEGEGEGEGDAATTLFLAGLSSAAERLRGIVAAELRRQLGAGSAQDAAREAFMRGEGGDQGDDDQGDRGDATEPPPGRDWAAEVRVGIHAHPSMSHLHVHVLSRDMHSERLRKRSHYNSFTTPFFVPLDAFPLAADDPRMQDGSNAAHMHGSMACWRCGRQFGNRFADLKRHLESEFQAWKRE